MKYLWKYFSLSFVNYIFQWYSIILLLKAEAALSLVLGQFVWYMPAPTHINDTLGNIIGRMHTPVLEAFSYGIRHIHCDSMKHKVILHWITMNVPYPIWKWIPYRGTHPPYSLWPCSDHPSFIDFSWFNFQWYFIF